MFPLNDTQTLKFLLIGIPGLQKSHIWVSIPFPFVYLLSFLGNVIVLFFIKTEQSLHKPMYFFLSMLSISDLGLSLSSLPTTLGLFLLGIHEIHAAACFAQEFFIHLFTVTEASVLSVMAFDRYVAIHSPLKYSTILTSSRVIKIGVSLTSKNVLFILPLPFLLQRLNYCH
jgi:olfactory receptor